jgi:hypothetical protein
MPARSWRIGVGTTTKTDPAVRLDTTSRSPCTIPMASPARHREKAAQIQLPAARVRGAVQRRRASSSKWGDAWGNAPKVNTDLSILHSIMAERTGLTSNRLHLRWHRGFTVECIVSGALAIRPYYKHCVAEPKVLGSGHSASRIRAAAMRTFRSLATTKDTGANDPKRTIRLVVKGAPRPPMRSLIHGALNPGSERFKEDRNPSRPQPVLTQGPNRPEALIPCALGCIGRNTP